MRNTVARSIILGLAFTALAAPQNSYSIEFEKFCKGVPKPEFPKVDLATSSEEKNLAKCDAYDLLHGVSQDSDFAKARKCALLHLSKKASKECKGDDCDDAFDAEALVEIYANGSGVKKNLPMARAVACHYGSVYFEDFLEQLNGSQSTPLDICSSIMNAGPGAAVKSHCDHYDQLKKRRVANLKPNQATKCHLPITTVLEKGDEVSDQLKVDENTCVAMVYSQPSRSDPEEDIMQGSFSVYLIAKDKATSQISVVDIRGSGDCSEGPGKLKAFVDKQGAKVFEASGTHISCSGGNASTDYKSLLRIENRKLVELK